MLFQLKIPYLLKENFIAQLKKKYDAVQKEHPDKFPMRKTSKVEKFMDEN